MPLYHLHQVQVIPYLSHHERIMHFDGKHLIGTGDNFHLRLLPLVVAGNDCTRMIRFKGVLYPDIDPCHLQGL